MNTEVGARNIRSHAGNAQLHFRVADRRCCCSFVHIKRSEPGTPFGLRQVRPRPCLSGQTDQARAECLFEVHTAPIRHRRNPGKQILTAPAPLLSASIGARGPRGDAKERKGRGGDPRGRRKQAQVTSGTGNRRSRETAQETQKGEGWQTAREPKERKGGGRAHGDVWAAGEAGAGERGCVASLARRS